MENKINNESSYNIYIWFITGLNVIALIFVVLLGLTISKLIALHWLHLSIMIFGLFYLASLLIEYLTRPAYFETFISNDEIIIKTFTTDRYKGFKFAFLQYKDNLLKYRISKDSYNDYKILGDRFSFSKQIILMRIENNLIKESQPISLSFICTKRYIDLILAIDRLTGKMRQKI